MADIGMKVSKPGIDVNATDVKDQVINSEHNSLKIWMTGSVNISKTAGSGNFSVNVAHNLGYTPFYLTYFKLVHATKYWFQGSLDDSILPADFVFGDVEADSTNLTLIVRDNSGVAPFTAVAYYVILIDKAYE